MRRQRPEDELQRAVVQWLTLRRPRGFWFHPPLGGARSRTEAAIMKGLGVKAGVPDLVFITAGAGLELKADRGHQSRAQREVQREFHRLGLGYGVARDLHQVERLMASWGLLEPSRGVLESLLPPPRQLDCREFPACGLACSFPKCMEAER